MGFVQPWMPCKKNNASIQENSPSTCVHSASKKQCLCTVPANTTKYSSKHIFSSKSKQCQSTTKLQKNEKKNTWASLSSKKKKKKKNGEHFFPKKKKKKKKKS